MRSKRTMLVGSLIWAVLHIVVAYAFRGRAAGMWSSGLLLAGWSCWFYYRTAKRGTAGC